MDMAFQFKGGRLKVMRSRDYILQFLKLLNASISQKTAPEQLSEKALPPSSDHSPAGVLGHWIALLYIASYIEHVAYTNII